MEHGSPLLETLTISLFAAVALQILASRIKVPAIAFLLLGGILLGPEVLHVVDPDALGHGLPTVISLAVAVILFEGGLTLEFEGFRLAPTVINRMLTVGVLITWAGTAALILLLYDYSVSFAVMAASLTIVTGPTVIGPILRRVRVGERLHSILHWEGVLIDPIGVFIALLTFEWLVSQAAALPLLTFLGRFALSVPAGALGGYLIGWLLRSQWLDEEWDNLVVLGSVLMLFSLCDSVLSEAGLLAVTVAGFVLSQAKSRRVQRIKKFKLEITQLSIGVVFILLAARLDIDLFLRLGAGGIVLLLGVMVVIRPLNVLASTVRSPLSHREKAFLAFLAPRGIVAASMASLFTLRLVEYPQYADSAWFLEVFTYAVILATVMIQGFGAGTVARLLGVEEPARRTWLIVGARYFGQDLAKALQRADVPSLLVDVNRKNVAEARRRGLNAVQADILDVNLFDDTRFYDVGTMLCATGNSVLDELACHRWQEMLGSDRCYRWHHDDTAPTDEAGQGVQEGQPVWTTIDGVRQVDGDLEAGEAAVELVDFGPGHRRPPRRFRVLFSVGEGVASLLADAPAALPGESTRAIVLSAKERPLYSPVRSVITIDLAEPTLRAVLELLLDEASNYQPDLEREALLQTMLDREHAMSSYVGQGVSIPHAYCGKTGDPLSVVGRLRSPIDVGGFDEAPVRLVFLLLSPEGQAQRHLEALGQLARLASNDDFLDDLTRAGPDDEALRLVRAEHRKHATGRHEVEPASLPA